MLAWIFISNLLWGVSAFAEIPSFDSVRKNDSPSDVLFLDRKGLEIGTTRLNSNFRKLKWISLESIAPLAKKTLVSIEDQHFFEHTGVDWFALTRSAIDLAQGKKARGASTITMQLVSLIDPTQEKHGKRSLTQKWDQVQAALELEKKWTKTQILEAYLNLVPFRGESVGIHAAAHFILQKQAQALDPVDAAILIALLPAPNLPWDKIAERACVFLRETQADPSFCSETQKRISLLSQRESSSPTVSPHSYFQNHFLKKKSTRPEDVKTSLDLVLQEKIYSFAQETIRSIQNQNVREAAVLVLENQTGSILAYIGNLPQFSKSPYVDGIQARRQIGSTLKPFFYGLALENRKMDLSTVLIDEPLQIQTTNGTFRPDNYDHEFHGEVSLADSLASSLNIPAIKVVQSIGVDSAVSLLKKLGFQELKSGYVYGPSIALGTVDATLDELTHAYHQLATQSFLKNSPKFPISQEHSQQIVRILSDRDARSLTFGLNSVLNTPYFSAVKTGTSKDMRDNWCVGFSDRVTVGVWVGNFNGNPMKDVSGVTGAAPLWRKVMDYTHSTIPALASTTHAITAIQKIELPHLISPKKETIPSTHNKIIYPQEGAVFAYDLEIPESKQKIFFRSQQASKEQFWQINGKKLGYSDEVYFWPVERGKFKLELIDSAGKTVDQVSFTVK